MLNTRYEKKAHRYSLGFIKKKILYREGLSLKIATDSMQPLIDPLDRVVVKNSRAEDLKPGDIVMFERGSTLHVHRLLDKRIQNGEPVLVPKADRAYTEEEPFPDKRLLGKVSRIHKKSMSIYLDKWHGRAINSFFHFYSLFKMKAYHFKCSLETIFSRDVKIEDNLIRLCSVTTIDDERKAAIRRLLNQHINWDYFSRKVKGEDTSSLIYKALNQSGGMKSKFPHHIQSYVRDFYYAVSGRNISLLQSLENIAIYFKKENIEAIVFKGLMLAHAIYKDIGLRPMGDIDLLIRREDIATADRALRRHGFSPEFEIEDFEGVMAGQYRNSVVYRSADSVPVSVHIHWHIVNFFPFHKSVLQKIDMDLVWEESEPIRLDNAYMRTFSLHHHIIYLCMHALNHSFHPLVRLSDINEVLRLKGDQIVWDKLINDALAFNLSKCVYYVLYLVSVMFNTDVPGAVLQRLKPQRIGLIEQTFLSSVLRGAPILTGEWLICFGMNESIKDRFLFLWRLLFPPQRELALIRKRHTAKASVLDYVKRMNSGIYCALKVIFSFTKQVSLRP